MHAFEKIYEEHKGRIFNLCLNYLQNRQEAEEAAQDIFVKIYQKLASFRGDASLTTWAYRITINHCLDMLRARKRSKRLAVLLPFLDTRHELAADLLDFDHPGVQLEDREALERLFRHINLLPGNQRTALILKYMDDLPQREIALVMHLSEKAVESLLQRAKQGLEKRMKRSEGM